jgi:hypothetical protein
MPSEHQGQAEAFKQLDDTGQGEADYRDRVQDARGSGWRQTVVPLFCWLSELHENRTVI